MNILFQFCRFNCPVEDGAFAQVALEQCYSNNLVRFSGKAHTTSRSSVVKLADSEAS